MRQLLAATVATNEEVLYFIKRNHLMGRGIGYIDAHLLAAVALTETARLWTRDKHLAAIVEAMNFALTPHELAFAYLANL
ncbi:MAG TPA: hypothetical protein VHJ19_12105 [Gammaproteobacteria bacterium]|jgi:predicted nucleic acid-binding protein|nr:hypothetical protein [Gammaproteobacteria bacterium]